jgi:diguanylate cyclase (GGDEF)-like protein/PAS domain S-box-containing protein
MECPGPGEVSTGQSLSDQENPDHQGLFEQAMRHAAIGMALVTAEGRFLEVNAALCRLLGRDEASLRHLLLREVTHPDDLADSLLLVEEMVAGERDAFQCEKRYIHADGHPIWGQVSVSCLRRDGSNLFIVQIVDISETRRQREILAEQEHQYRLLAENAADVVCRFDLEGRISWLSASVQRSLGWRPEQLLGQRLKAITHADDWPTLSELQGQGHRSVVLDLRLGSPEGEYRWMSVMARPIQDQGGRWIGWISGWRDIQAEVEMRRQLDQALHTDPLTGLASRGALLRRIAASLACGDRPTHRAVLSIGIDRLSQVNDALTHRAGDLLLSTLARRLAAALEKPEQVARGTGDTFIVLLERLESPEQAGAIAERLRLACKGAITYAGHTIEPSVSIGLALTQAGESDRPSTGPTADELLRDATLAMRDAADRGRDRCAFADPGLALRAQEGLQLQQELRHAIETGALHAWYMPLVDLSDGALLGYEALVRWQRPDGRLEMPDTFLPVARSCQLAVAIDLQVLQQSIAALAALPPPLTVAANLGAATLTQTGLVEQVQRWLEQAGVAPRRLHLEITETALIDLGPEVTGTIQALAALGVRWMVDDFGTGFSSISHLRDLPIYGLKLDRSFTEGLRHGDQKSVRLAQALAGLAEGLGLETVAEGIESAEEASSLRDLGWRGGQGWYFGQAAPLAHWQEAPKPALISPRVAVPMGSSRSSWALAVTDNVPVGLFALRVDPGGRPNVVFASRRSLDMLQLERDQINDDLTLVLMRFHPGDRQTLLTAWQQSGASPTPLSWEGRLQIAGTTSWVSVEAAPLPQTDGSLIWQGVLTDISDRKRQELHLQRLLDEAPIAMAINDLRDEDPRITYVNQQFIRSFGYDLSTIPHLSDWARLAYPDPRQRETVFRSWDAGVAKARRGGGVVEPIEAKVTAADGSERDALFSAVVLGEELVLSVLDITAWRQAERELQEARSALADTALAITEAIPVGTYTMRLPPEGGMASFGFMSERFLQICGLQRQEAAADPLKAFACVHPDDYDAWVQLNAEAFAHKTPFYGECRILVNGELRWISAESVPRDLPDGSTVWEGVLIDITKQRQMLEQLEQDRALLETVLSHIDAHVYMKDRQGRYLYANASVEQMLLHRVDVLTGRTDAELLPAAAAEAIQQVDARVFREGGPVWMEERLPLPDGGERIFLSEKLIYRPPGQEECLIGFSTEITQLRQASDQLAASEEHFRLLAENSSDVVFLLAQDGRILWVSPSLTSALGWRPEEWLGKVGTDFLVHRGEAEHYRTNLQSLRGGGQSTLARDQVRAKDGTSHWIETHAGPYRRADGEVEGIVASFRLIDDIVAAEQQLLQSEQRHRRLADNILDVVWSIDLQGRFTYMSPSVQRLRGFTPEEVMALPLEANFTPDSFRIVVAGLEQARRDALAGHPVAFEAELEETCKDGSTIRTEVRATSLFDEQGRFVEIVGMTRDVSAQYRLREELRISEERYRLLAENARDVIWTMEPDGTVSYLSPSIQLLRGISPEDAMAQPLEQIHPPESRQRSQAYFNQLREDVQAGRAPQPFRGELEYYCQDGSTIWAEVIALPIVDAGGHFQKLLGVSRDISERKRFENELMVINQQLQELATTDGLTGIWNRRHLEAQIQQVIERADRYAEPLALILCDIDLFKRINDRLGHQLGDQVLIEFCRRIRCTLRSTDAFGRWGGEEFLIVLPQSDVQSAAALAEKLRQLIAGTPFSQVGRVTASFGVAQRLAREPEDQWLRRADQNLYAAKEAGRNRVVAT